MTFAAKRVFAFALLACIVLLVIHPVLDIPETTLGSKILAVTMLYAMVVAFFSAQLFFAPSFDEILQFLLPESADSARSSLSALRC